MKLSSSGVPGGRASELQTGSLMQPFSYWSADQLLVLTDWSTNSTSVAFFFFFFSRLLLSWRKELNRKFGALWPQTDHSGLPIGMDALSIILRLLAAERADWLWNMTDCVALTLWLLHQFIYQNGEWCGGSDGSVLALTAPIRHLPNIFLGEGDMWDALNQSWSLI